MHATRLYTVEDDIHARLSYFNVTRADLINVVREVVGARADAVEDDPINAAGQFAYIHGTRNTRALFRSKGWVSDRKDNIEAVRDPQRQVKVIYQNVDLACEVSHDPQAISGKGSGAERAIDLAQASLFPVQELDALSRRSVTLPPSGIWFFCVSVDGDNVRAELSKASGVKGGNFRGFDERIFIVRKGEWAEMRIKDDDMSRAEFEPMVRRKQG